MGKEISTSRQELRDLYGRSLADAKEQRELAQRLNEIAAENFDDPAWRNEIAQELTETIYLGFEHENLLAYLTQVQNAGFNERVLVREARGLRAFFVARGGYIEASGMHQNVIEVPRVTCGFHVNEFEDKLRTDFAETQATLVELGVQRLDATINSWMFSTLQAGVTSASPYYESVSGLSSNLGTLDSAITSVRDVSRDFEVVIVGRSTMIDQIRDALVQTGTPSVNSRFLPETNEELFRRGVIGSYWGAKIVTLKNYVDDTGTPFFPANELWVLGRDASKFVFFGSPITHEWLDPPAGEWHYMSRRDLGMVVHRPYRTRRIIDSTITAYTTVSD
jgi:hypothetical protein